MATTTRRVALELAARLLAFVKEHRLGHVCGADAGFRLPSKNVRSPDVSFVASGRFPNDEPPDDFGSLAPDLAVDESLDGEDVLPGFRCALRDFL